MFNRKNITGLEMTAQFEADHTANVKITTKPNVNWLRVVYNSAEGKADDELFSYFLDGKNGKVREVNREFANDILTQEAGA